MSLRSFALFLLSTILFGSTASAQAPRKPFTPVEDIAGLPRVLLIGDSISIGYTVAVQDYLQGKANVHRVGENCGPTTKGLEKIEQWLGNSKWDVIHFNFGLHDLKYMDDQGKLAAVDQGKQQVAPVAYEKNLTSIVTRLQATGAHLIWRTTTPVPAGAKGRIPGDALRYNRIAQRVMETKGVDDIDDLYLFAAGRLQRIQQPANVHFTKSGSSQLALQVAKKIEAALPRPTTTPQVARGLVYHDANANRRYDEGETPLPNIRVSNGRQIVQTNEGGQYALPVNGDTNLFVIKPQGWRPPRSKGNLSEFYYLHRPQGSPVSYYPGIAPTGPLPDRVDFALYPQKEPDTFKAIMWGDPQPRDQKELDYIAHDVVEELIGTDASFGVTLGDILFDDLALFEAQTQLVALIGIPWYNVIGNHDINYDANNDHHSDETFERHFGPAYYSFDYGKVHFLVLDDVEWVVEQNGKKRYVGGLGEDQIEFIREDLASIPENQLVVLMMHVPLVNVRDRQELYRLIEKRPFCMSISGHTHTHEHRLIDKADGWLGKQPHHHVINVTVSGAWWSGNPDERGIPHTVMTDGAPNGYSIISFDGNQYKLDFKAAGRSENYQIQIHMPEVVTPQLTAAQAPPQGPSPTFYANVFNGSEQSQVEFRVDQTGEWTPMTWSNTIDPLLEKTYQRESAIRDKLLSVGALPKTLPTPMSKPKPSTHLWKAAVPDGLSPGSHLLEVRAKLAHPGTSTENRVVGRRTFRVSRPAP